MKFKGSPSPLGSIVETMTPSLEEELWIFGYGSLMWNPSFEHEQVLPCYVEGYARRFWQGNASFRGCSKLPGRVLTLHADDQSRTYGLAFLVRGASKIAACLAHLQRREIDEGYQYQHVEIVATGSDGATLLNYSGGQEVTSNCAEEGRSVVITALTCIARPDNPLFLGDAPLKSTARQIALAKGFAGPNADYLLSCAKLVRTYFPEDFDSHLFALERMVRTFLKSRIN